MTNGMLHPPHDPNNGFRLTDKGILHVSSSPRAKHDPKMMAHGLTSITFCKTPKALNYGSSISLNFTLKTKMTRGKLDIWMSKI